MLRPQTKGAQSAGFSLLELMIAMTITLVVLGASSMLLSGAFNTRARENQKSDALADAQRAVNMMTREIANSGFGLSNGIVDADSGTSKIRIRANLNALDKELTSDKVSDRDEDIKYELYTDAEYSYIVRLDINTAAQETVLANRVDTLRFYYFADKVDYTTGDCVINLPTGVSEVTTKSSAKYIVILVCVTLPERGTAGSVGYQPQRHIQLVSDVSLRNSSLTNY